MESHEALIHITAPSTRLDDQRYAAQTAAIIASFEPSRRIDIYPAEDLVVENAVFVSRSGSPTRFSTPERHVSAIESGLISSSSAHVSASDSASKERGDEYETYENLQSPQFPNVSRTLRFANQIPPLHLPQTGPVNPPYRDPFYARQRHLTDIQRAQTADEPRPRTAPAVPASYSRPPGRAQKRSHSESSSFETLASVVPDSQTGSHRTETSSPEERRLRKRQRLQEFRDGLAGRAPNDFVDAPVPTASNSSSEGRASDPFKLVRESKKSDSIGQVRNLQRALEPEFSALPDTRSPPCFFLANRDYDYDTSVETSSEGPSSQHTESTESPSQARYLSFGQLQETPKASVEVQPEHIDLTTPAHTSSASASTHVLSNQVPRTELSSGVPNSETSAIASDQQNDHPSTPYASSSAGFHEVHSLPRTIFPSPPPTSISSTAFPISHLTPQLDLLASKLSIPRRFRPLSVSRPVSSSERGYWLIHLGLGSETLTSKRRESINSIRSARLKLAAIHSVQPGIASERDGKTGFNHPAQVIHSDQIASLEDDNQSSINLLLAQATQPEPSYLWTVSEFIKFYNSLQKNFISSIVGWGTRIFLEFPDPAPSILSLSSYSGDELNVDLKITTFAELIPHIYLMLWVLSDRRTAEMPMEWRAGDEQTVIQMAGGGMPRIDKDKDWIRGMGWGRISRQDIDGPSPENRSRPNNLETFGGNEEPQDNDGGQNASNNGDIFWGIVPTTIPVFLDR